MLVQVQYKYMFKGGHLALIIYQYLYTLIFYFSNDIYIYKYILYEYIIYSSYINLFLV